MNKIILMGRLVREPSVKITDKSLKICNYTIAVNRRFKQGEADFFDCVAFGKVAEFVERWLHKGNMIAVVGRIEFESYTGKDGVNRKSTKVIADEHYFCGEKSKADKSLKQPVTEEQAAEMFYPVDEEYGDDDFPF